MANNTSTVNVVKIGMNSDIHEMNAEKGFYSFALNAIIEDFNGAGFPQIQNTPSNVLAVNFPSGFKVIGRKVIHELSRTIYCITNGITSEIGEVIEEQYEDKSDEFSVKECGDCSAPSYIENVPLEKIKQIPYLSYRTIVSDSCLKFNIDYPVDIEYKITNKGINLYFVDNLNPIRFLYLDLINGLFQVQNRFKILKTLNPDNCNTPIYEELLDCNKIKYNPNYSRPCIEFIDEIAGGSLKAGSYQAMIAYSDKLSNPLTPYFPTTNPISIASKQIFVNNDYETNKGLAFKINNLDDSQLFSYYNLVIAETVNNFTSFKLVGTYPITQKNINYTGNELDYKTLTPNDVFFEKPIYKTASSITKANDFLFIGNVKENKKLNLQQAVNKVKLYWQTKAVKEGIYGKAKGSNKYRSYARDEVYAFGLVFSMVDDNDTIAFPLVGPSKQYLADAYQLNVDEIITNNDVLDDTSCLKTQRNKKWQVYNTARIIGQPHRYSIDCDDDAAWEWGEFAYWESTETYPNLPEIWGDLCGKPIRLFKFPDSNITHIHDSLNGVKEYNDENIIFPLGVKVDHTSVKAALLWAVDSGLITSDDLSRIKGYKLVRANRVGNETIVARGLLYDLWEYEKDGSKQYYPNYPYNDLNEDIFLAPDGSTYNEGNSDDANPGYFKPTGRYTFHSPDVHFNNPEIGTEIKLDVEEYGKSEGYFNECNGEPTYRILSTAARSFAFAYGVAAAISSITKTCRTIEKQTLKTNAKTGNTFVAAGSIPGAIAPVPVVETELSTFTEIPIELPTFKYNGILAGSPVLANKVTIQDCKGTPYHWLNPAYITEMTPEFGTGAAIMLAVNIVAGPLSFALHFITTMVREINTMTELIKSLLPNHKYFIQYNSVGRYNNYKLLNQEGYTQRLIEASAYLNPMRQIVNETVTSTVKINNWNRESSVFIKTDSGKPLFPKPTKPDNSKVSVSSAGLSYGQLNVRFNRDISSYYATIKRFKPDQYGNIYNLEFIETDSCYINLTDEVSSNKTSFGGDKFITRFALKRKHPFFIQTRFKQLRDSDVLYSTLGNAAYPNYYIDYGVGLMERLGDIDISDVFSHPAKLFESLVGTDHTRLDAKTKKFFYQNGYVHLYNYGIPYFIVESDVNTDLRHGENNTDRDFYPHQRDLTTWLQEENVSIKEDNWYFYNKSYSKQNKESFIKPLTPAYTLEDTVINRVIHTEKRRTLGETDNWLLIKGNNFYDSDSINGRLISVDSIEDDKVLVRSENSTQIFSAYDTIKTESSSIQIGTGGMFDGRVKEFAVTDLGYMGTQHRDILKTEFGHVFVDAKRGQVLLLNSSANGMEEISRNGMRNWFKQNLPFKIIKDFPTIAIEDIDNNYKGIGLHLSFDKRYNMFYLTKLDYKVINANIRYNTEAKKFYLIDEPDTFVNLTDTRYFCNKSWTISYNFISKLWSSFHSFTPNFYNDFIDYTQSGLNNEISNVWSHRVTNKSHQVYYGKLYPFIIDVFSDPSITNNVLNSIEYVNDVYRFINEYDFIYKQNITFNKAYVYNQHQNSGLLNLVLKNENDLSLLNPDDTVGLEGHFIQVSNAENVWRFNEFYDSVSCDCVNAPLWFYDCNNVNKSLNYLALNYNKYDLNRARIRGRMSHVRFVNDKWSNYKFVFLLNQFNQNKSFK